MSDILAALLLVVSLAGGLVLIRRRYNDLLLYQPPVQVIAKEAAPHISVQDVLHRLLSHTRIHLLRLEQRVDRKLNHLRSVKAKTTDPGYWSELKAARRTDAEKKDV